MEATIMIPAYNAEGFLPQALDSALDQTYHKPYEVLVVNDGSKDDTQGVLEFYAKKDLNLKFFNQKNKGIGATRERLVRESQGKILLGLDADDKLNFNALEKVVGFFDANPKAGFVYTNQQEIDEKGNVLGERKRESCHQFFNDLIYYCHFPGHLRSFRKEMIQNFSFDSDLKTAEDWDFLLKILPFVEIGHLPETLYSYRINQDGISIGMGNKTINVSVALLKRFIKERKFYEQSDFKIVPIDVGGHIIYYDHFVDGKSTMKLEARKVLERYLRSR